MIDGLPPSGMINRETFLSLTSLSHLTHLSYFQGNVLILRYIQITWWKMVPKINHLSGPVWHLNAVIKWYRFISATFHHIYVYTTSIHIAQHLESRSKSEMKNSSLKSKPNRTVMMLMSKEKHFKKLLLRNNCWLKNSYVYLGNMVYSLILFLHSLLILDSYQLTLLNDVFCLSPAAQRDLALF